MLDHISKSPWWYFIWATTVGIGAIYVLGKGIILEGLSVIDYSALTYVIGSIGLEMYLSPKLKRDASTQ